MSEVVISYRATTPDVHAVRLRTDAYKRGAPPTFGRRGRSRNWELRLAAFHAHRVQRQLVGGLFMQSSSFFRRTTDSQELGFPRFERISRFAGGVLRAESAPAPIPIVMTCGRIADPGARGPLDRGRLGRRARSSS